MKKLLILISFSTLFSCIDRKDETPSEIVNHVKVNDPLPQFTVEDGYGNELANTDFKGKKSLLVLFHTGCGDCQKVLPVVNDVWLELKDDPDCMVATIARKQTLREVEDYWKTPKNYSKSFTMPHYLDPRAETFLKFANNYVPRLYIVNTEGVVTWFAVEKLDLTAAQLVEKIRSQK